MTYSQEVRTRLDNCEAIVVTTKVIDEQGTGSLLVGRDVNTFNLTMSIAPNEVYDVGNFAVPFASWIYGAKNEYWTSDPKVGDRVSAYFHFLADEDLETRYNEYFLFEGFITGATRGNGTISITAEQTASAVTLKPYTLKKSYRTATSVSLQQIAEDIVSKTDGMIRLGVSTTPDTDPMTINLRPAYFNEHDGSGHQFVDWMKKITIAEAMSKVAKVAVANWVYDRRQPETGFQSGRWHLKVDNTLELQTFDPYEGTMYEGVDLYSFSKVALVNMDGNELFYVGDNDGNVLRIENPWGGPFADSSAGYTGRLMRFLGEGRGTYPGTYEFQGGLYLDPGDRIIVDTADGLHSETGEGLFNVMIHTIEFSIDGGVRTKVTSYGAVENADGSNESNVTSTQNIVQVISKPTKASGSADVTANTWTPLFTTDLGAGTYQIMAHIYFPSGTAGFRGGWVQVGDEGRTRRNVSTTEHGSNQSLYMHWSFMAELEDNETITVQARSSVALNVSGAIDIVQLR